VQPAGAQRGLQQHLYTRASLHGHELLPSGLRQRRGMHVRQCDRLKRLHLPSLQLSTRTYAAEPSHRVLIVSRADVELSCIRAACAGTACADAALSRRRTCRLALANVQSNRACYLAAPSPSYTASFNQAQLESLGDQMVSCVLAVQQ
jgi:hypothetical protein